MRLVVLCRRAAHAAAFATALAGAPLRHPVAVPSRSPMAVAQRRPHA
uniref:Uncharacterized protein n=1 Tax=Arundo donax TaxID=35708 RepID=A0A0A8YF17_ARUDO